MPYNSSTRQPLGEMSLSRNNTQAQRVQQAELPPSLGEVVRYPAPTQYQTIHYEQENAFQQQQFFAAQRESSIQWMQRAHHAHAMYTDGRLLPAHKRGYLLYSVACLNASYMGQENVATVAERRILEEQRIKRANILETMKPLLARHAPQQIPTFPLTDVAVAGEQLCLLFKARLFDRYGFIATEVCDRMRAAEETEKIMLWEEYSLEFWIDYARYLEDEHEIILQKSANIEEISESDGLKHMELMRASWSIGLPWSEIDDFIKAVGQARDLPGPSMRKLILNLDADALKQQLFNDLCDLPRLIDPVDEFSLRLIRTIICVLIDYLFDRNTEISIAEEKSTGNWVLRKRASQVAGEMRTAEAAQNSGAKVIYAVMEEQIVDDVAWSMEDNISFGSIPNLADGFDEWDGHYFDAARLIGLMAGIRIPLHAWYKTELEEHIRPRRRM